MTSPYDSWNSRRPFVRVLNTTAESIPPFACMELAYTSTDCTEMVDGELHWKVKKPTSTAVTDLNRVIINSGTKIAANGLGISYVDDGNFQVYANTSTSPTIGQGLSPVSGQWYASPSAATDMFKFLSLDSGLAYSASSTLKTVWATRAKSGSGSDSYMNLKLAAYASKSPLNALAAQALTDATSYFVDAASDVSINGSGQIEIDESGIYLITTRANVFVTHVGSPTVVPVGQVSIGFTPTASSDAHANILKDPANAAPIPWTTGSSEGYIGHHVMPYWDGSALGVSGSFGSRLFHFYDTLVVFVEIDGSSYLGPLQLDCKVACTNSGTMTANMQVLHVNVFKLPQPITTTHP